MKKLGKLCSVALLVMVLGGCQAKEKQPLTEETTINSTTVKKKTPSNPNKKEKPRTKKDNQAQNKQERKQDGSCSTGEKQGENLWNSEKAASLESFVIKWGETLDQTYQSYAPKRNVDLYGLYLPDAVLDNNTNMVLKENKQNVDIEWSSTGCGQKAYQLVAVYSDAATQPYLKQHVYFFVLEGQTPHVFLTQQNQGNPENNLYFSETQNEALKNGFASILRGEEPVVPVKEATPQVSHDYNQATANFIQQRAGTYYDENNQPFFKLDETYFTDVHAQSGKKYKIAGISDSNPQGMLTIAWDMDDFAARYGRENLGPGPQPFMFVITDNPDVLESQRGDSYTRR